MTGNENGPPPRPVSDTDSIHNTRDHSSSGCAAPKASQLLATPGACLTRSHLRELGHGRRGIDAIFRACPCVVLPGYSRPMIRVSDFLALMDRSTVAGGVR